MKILLGILVILIVAGVLAISMSHHSGYVIVHLAHTQIEVAFWTAAVTLFVAFIVLYIIIRLLCTLFGLGKTIRTHRRINNMLSVQQRSDDGCMAMLNGQWMRANNHFAKALGHTRHPLLLTTLAGYCAQQQGDLETRDKLLDDLAARLPNKSEQIQLAKIQLLMENKQWEQVLPMINTLKKHNHKPYVTYLHAQTLAALEEWGPMGELLDELKKHQDLAAEPGKTWAMAAYTHRLQHCTHSLSELNTAWHSIPKTFRHNNEIVACYAAQLILLQQQAEAQATLRQQLKKHWNATLLSLLAKTVDHNPEKLLTEAKRWLSDHPNDCDLLALLGQICLKLQFLTQAKEYLELACKIEQRPQLYQLLSDVMLADNHVDAALGYLQKSRNL